jgi:hypothetical protein
MRNVSAISCRENKNTFYVRQLVFRKLCPLNVDVEKSGGARDAKDDNTAHPLCMLGK